MCEVQVMVENNLFLLSNYLKIKIMNLALYTTFQPLLALCAKLPSARLARLPGRDLAPRVIVEFSRLECGCLSRALVVLKKKKSFVFSTPIKIISWQPTSRTALAI